MGMRGFSFTDRIGTGLCGQSILPIVCLERGSGHFTNSNRITGREINENGSFFREVEKAVVSRNEEIANARPNLPNRARREPEKTDSHIRGYSDYGDGRIFCESFCQVGIYFNRIHKKTF